jgi:hypothetical protein
VFYFFYLSKQTLFVIKKLRQKVASDVKINVEVVQSSTSNCAFLKAHKR